MRVLLLLGIILGLAHGQPKPTEKKDLPRVLVALPLGVALGKEVKVLLRGLRLDTAMAVEFTDSKSPVKILRKGKVAVPNQQKAEQVGDTELELQFLSPATETGAGKLHLEVTTPTGKSAPHALLLNGTTVQAEKEPNHGYASAQTIRIGQTVAGTVTNNQDVDCFRFEAEAGQLLVAEVFAARLGSPLDSFLTLTDEAGRVLVQADDLPDNRDARIEFRLPRTGAYFLTLQDAHDMGGSTHVYQLQVRTK